MTAIVRVPFHNTALQAVDVDGKPFIVFRPAVESIGLDYSTQLAKLRGRSWVNRRDIPTVGADGKNRVMVALSLSAFLMWLATVNENKVAEEVRPLLIAYQQESADVVRDYWTQGGAINPRATEDQLAAIIGRAEAQARVLRTLDGLVDARWLEAKARHVAARALGEEPEVDPAARPLTVGEYLSDRGVSGASLRSLSSGFGKRLKGLYIAEHGTEPPRVERFVDGALRQVAGYTEADRPLFDAVYSALKVAHP